MRERCEEKEGERKREKEREREGGGKREREREEEEMIIKNGKDREYCRTFVIYSLIRFVCFFFRFDGRQNFIASCREWIYTHRRTIEERTVHSFQSIKSNR